MGNFLFRSGHWADEPREPHEAMGTNEGGYVNKHFQTVEVELIWSNGFRALHNSMIVMLAEILGLCQMR